MSFFSEIKRRKVFRLAAAYIVIAWVIIQVVTQIEEPLHLPGWFDTAVIVLLGLGFPIAVMLSWAYDVTPDGVVREGTGERAPAPLQIDYGKIALVAVLILGGFLLGNYIKGSPSQAPPQRTTLRQWEIGVPPEYSFPAFARRTIAIAPDGRTVVLAASINSQNYLFSREVGSTELMPIPGTEDFEGITGRIAISPDSKSVTFRTARDGLLKTVSLNGGIPAPVVQVPGGARSLTWGDNGAIVYGDGAYRGLMHVSADGGDAVEFGFSDGNDALKHPSFIPGTDWLVLAVGKLGLTVNSDDRIALMSPDGVVRMTSLNGSSPRVSPDGRLVFARGNTLWSVAFDLGKLEVSGDPAPFQDDVYYGFFSHYDISREGSLVFWRNDANNLNTLVWVDRDGNEQATPLSRARYRSPGVSPDGDLIAVSKYTAGVPDLWTHSLSRGEATQRTFEITGETHPVWSSSGDTLYFELGQPPDVYRIVPGGERGPERLTDTPESWLPNSVTPDNRYLIFDEWGGSEGDGNNVGQLDLSKNGVQGANDIEYLLKSDYRESHPKLSPDGELLAYELDRGGSVEIWVRRYPLVDGESPVRVSISGDCQQPMWNADSRELYYWNRDDERIYAAKIDTSNGLDVETPVELFSTEPYAFDFLGNYNYDQSRDMFLMIKKPLPGSTPNQIVFVENWQELIDQQNE